MRRFHITVLLTLILVSTGAAQHLLIIDSDNRKPVSEVYVYDDSQGVTAFSESNGIIDLSPFLSSTTIFLQHPSYDKLKVDVSELKEGENKIYLSEKIVHFEEVTVSASKWEQEKDNVAQEIVAITSKDIQFQNPQTSADLLNQTGQVFVQKSQFGGGSPSLRGFGANKVLLVMDGIRMNNAIYRSGNLQNVINIDPNAIARTEVVFGPGSVIYGSDALGGVMDFKTKAPEYNFEEGIGVFGSALTRYGSASEERTMHLDVGIGGDKIAYWGSLSITSLGDLEAGSRRSKDYEGFFERSFYADRENGIDVLRANSNPDLQAPTGFNLFNTIQKVKFRMGDFGDVGYSFYLSNTSDIPRYDRLTIPLNAGSDSLQYGDWQYGPQRWEMHALNFGYYEPTGLFEQLKVTLSYQDYQESRIDREFGDVNRRTRTENVDIFTASVDLEKEIADKTLIFYGIDGFFNDVTSSATMLNLETRIKSPTSTRYPNNGSQFYSLAGYATINHQLTQSFLLTAGARYNLVWLNASSNEATASSLGLNDLSNFNQALTGSLSGVYDLTESSKVTAVVSSGFRAPNLDDIGKLFELDEETIVVPNPNLQPEYVYSQEVSYHKKFNPVTKLDIVIYNSFLNNAIIRGELPGQEGEVLTVQGNDLAVRTQINADKARLYGGSIRLESKLIDHLALHGTFSINEGETQDGQPLRHATPMFGQTGIKYLKDQFYIGLISNFNLKRDLSQIPDFEILDKPHLYTDDGSPGWITVDVRGRYQIQNVGLTVESGIENILDQHYRPYSSGISAPGRNIYGALRYNF